jgi:hypothetical protein
VRILDRAAFILVASTAIHSASAQSSTVPMLLEGTPVMLQLDQKVDSANARMGQRVAFEVSSDVTVKDQVLIPTGSLALGTVTQASHHAWGHGRVSVQIDSVRLPGGQAIPLSSTADLEDNGAGTRDDAIASSLDISRRKAQVIPQGAIVRAFIRRDTVVVQQTASVSN